MCAHLGSSLRLKRLAQRQQRQLGAHPHARSAPSPGQAHLVTAPLCPRPRWIAPARPLQRPARPCSPQRPRRTESVPLPCSLQASSPMQQLLRRTPPSAGEHTFGASWYQAAGAKELLSSTASQAPDETAPTLAPGGTPSRATVKRRANGAHPRGCRYGHAALQHSPTPTLCLKGWAGSGAPREWVRWKRETQLLPRTPWSIAPQTRRGRDRRSQPQWQRGLAEQRAGRSA